MNKVQCYLCNSSGLVWLVRDGCEGWWEAILLCKIFKINSYFFPIFSGKFLFFSYFLGHKFLFSYFFDHSYYLTPCIYNNGLTPSLLDVLFFPVQGLLTRSKSPHVTIARNRCSLATSVRSASKYIIYYKVPVSRLIMIKKTPWEMGKAK